MEWKVVYEAKELEFESALETADEGSLIDAITDEIQDYIWEYICELVDGCPGNYPACSSYSEAEECILSYIKSCVEDKYNASLVVCTEVGNSEKTVQLSLKKIILEYLDSCWCDSSVCDPKIGGFIERILSHYWEESSWHFALKSELGEVIENVLDWPRPIKNDDEIIWGKSYFPLIWFGPACSEPLDKWVIWNGKNEVVDSIWFECDTWTVVDYLIDGADDGFLIWYTAEVCYGAPDMDEIRRSCPILIEENDTPDVTKRRINEYYLDLYKKSLLADNQ